MQYESLTPSMDLYPSRRTMEEAALTNITVTDVYDQAAGIGKEFEKLIESYGVEAVTDLMPKVIRSLEQLEALASKFEKESGEIAELKYAVDKLETEKADKVQERVRFEEELIQIEDTWQRESREQLTTIAKLQEENRRLKTNLSEQKQAVVEEVAAVTKKTEEKEIEVLTKLKETVDKQRDEVRKLKRENAQKNVDVEALQAQSERLVKVNMELRRKNTTQRKQARALLSDKVDLETQLAEKEQQVVQVQDLLRDQESADENLQQKLLLTGISEDQETVPVQTQLTPAGSVDSESEVQHPPPPAEGPDHLVEKLSLIGKVVIDPKDPNRPRFTLNELRTVLMERNELKAQLIEVEEELEKYRPRAKSDTPACLSEELDTTTDDDDLEKDDLEEDEEDPYDLNRPVQGPMPKEPWDKIHGKRPSGIRKFFNFVFGSPSPQEHSQSESRRKRTN